MKRTKLKDRVLPSYSRGEEIFNMVSHIVGGGLGVIALVLCVVFSALKGDTFALVTSIIYGFSLIALYTNWDAIQKNKGAESKHLKKWKAQPFAVNSSESKEKSLKSRQKGYTKKRIVKILDF